MRVSRISIALAFAGVVACGAFAGSTGGGGEASSADASDEDAMRAVVIGGDASESGDDANAIVDSAPIDAGCVPADAASDPNNCGGCGIACGAGSSCVAAICQPTRFATASAPFMVRASSGGVYWLEDSATQVVGRDQGFTSDRSYSTAAASYITGLAVGPSSIAYIATDYSTAYGVTIAPRNASLASAALTGATGQVLPTALAPGAANFYAGVGKQITVCNATGCTAIPLAFTNGNGVRNVVSDDVNIAYTDDATLYRRAIAGGMTNTTQTPDSDFVDLAGVPGHVAAITFATILISDWTTSSPIEVSTSNVVLHAVAMDAKHVYVLAEGNSVTVWRFDLDGGNKRDLGYGPQTAGGFAVSDGRVFYGDRDLPTGIYSAVLPP